MRLRHIARGLVPLVLLALASTAVSAEGGGASLLWDEYEELRDSVYNGSADAAGVQLLHNRAVEAARGIFSADVLPVALSRCDYMLGRFHSYAGDKEAAGRCYDSGAAFAEQALSVSDSAAANLMYGENISQNCSVKPVGYALKYGTKVGEIAERTLELDPSCGAAMYMLNARYVYAPRPFNNYRKGIAAMKGILDESGVVLHKDDLFNVLSAIGYAHMQSGNREEAEAWLSRALEVYPGNGFVRSLLDELAGKARRTAG